MKIFIFVVSFLLDGILSNYLPINGLFTPLFSLVSLIVVYPYFNGNKRDYYKYAFLLGLLYDLIYTDTLVFHAFLFLFMSFLITKLTLVLSDNYLNLIIITIITIIIFRSVSYILIFITGNINLDYHIFLKGIYSSLILNIIYSVILLFITNFISDKYNIKKNSHY